MNEYDERYRCRIHNIMSMLQLSFSNIILAIELLSTFQAPPELRGVIFSFAIKFVFCHESILDTSCSAFIYYVFAYEKKKKHIERKKNRGKNMMCLLFHHRFFRDSTYRKIISSEQFEKLPSVLIVELVRRRDHIFDDRRVHSFRPLNVSC